MEKGVESRGGPGGKLGEIHLEKKTSHLLGLRGRHQYPDQSFSHVINPCVASTAVGIERQEDQMARSSAKKEST